MAEATFEVMTAGQGTPQASVLLPTYRSAYVERALAALLAQHALTLEILISDDASGDDTPQRIRAHLAGYGGPHRVLLRQGRARLQLDHFALLAEAASCDVVIMAHDDDLALPQRAKCVLDLFMATGADVISSNCLVIDDQGRPQGTRIQGMSTGFIPVEEIIAQVWLPPFLGATLAWRRRVYADFPRLDSRYLPSGHDCLIPFRGALGNGFYYTDEALLQRRRHATQWSTRLIDRSSPLAGQEARAARLLGICVAMHKDIIYLQERTSAPANDNRPRLDQLEALITQSLIRQATTMFDRRSELLRAGQRVLWSDAAAGAHHDRRSGLQRFWRKWRRLRRGWLRQAMSR
jgi:hypothetical protein